MWLYFSNTLVSKVIINEAYMNFKVISTMFDFFN